MFVKIEVTLVTVDVDLSKHFISGLWQTALFFFFVFAAFCNIVTSSSHAAGNGFPVQGNFQFHGAWCSISLSGYFRVWYFDGLEIERLDINSK